MRDEQLLERIYDAALEPKAWSAFVEHLEASLGSAAVALSLPHPRPDDPGLLVAPSLDPRFVSAYQERYYLQDPVTPQLERLPVGSFAFGRGDGLNIELAATAFYREWLKPQGLLPEPLAGGVLERDEKHGIARIGVFRRRGGRRDVRAERRLAELLMPHLRRAVQIHFRRAELLTERRALAGAFDRVPLGLLLIDRAGRVRATNRAADRLLAEGDGLVRDRDGLHAASPEQTARLRELLARTACGGAGNERRQTAFLIPRPSGRRPLEALASPVCMADESVGSRRCLAALFVGDPLQGIKPPDALLRDLYGLTPAEAALTRELGSGRSLEECAKCLEITRGTARQRLGQVFAKTATSRQAALVHLLLSGPAQLGGDD